MRMPPTDEASSVTVTGISFLLRTTVTVKDDFLPRSVRVMSPEAPSQVRGQIFTFDYEHHLHETVLQKAVREAARNAGIAKATILYSTIGV